MGSFPSRRAAAVLLLLLLAVPSLPALADGMYFPERVRPVPLSIPSQRAILVFRNGVETLTVESTLDAKGQAFGWVVPVPAKPTAVEKATRGPLDVLDRVTEPDIVHETGFATGSRSWVFLFLAFLLFARAALVRWGWESRGFVGVILSAFVLLFLPLGLFSSLGPFRMASKLGGGGDPGYRSSSIPGVRADPTRRVGAYDVTVLQADDGSALGRWLEASGFAEIPNSGKPVAEALVREKWCFVAVRLAREEEGHAAPHPLRIVFPAREPVYPMRLTALAGGTTAVRLYVIAEEGRTAPGMSTIFRDRFHLGPRSAGASGSARGAGLHRMLAHPRLLPDLWDGCVLTHLQGTFRSVDMGRDVVCAAGSSEPLLARFWSENGARDTAAAYSIVSWAGLAFILLLVPPTLLPLKGRRGSPFLPCLLVLSMAAGVAFLVIRTSLPTIEVAVVHRYDEWERDPRPLLGPELPKEPKPEFPAMTDPEVEALILRRAARPGYWSVASGDSPGQFEVLTLGEGRVVRFYGDIGEPEDLVIPAMAREAR